MENKRRLEKMINLKTMKWAGHVPHVQHNSRQKKRNYFEDQDIDWSIILNGS
jgi:hypothetical protein